MSWAVRQSARNFNLFFTLRSLKTQIHKKKNETEKRSPLLLDFDNKLYFWYKQRDGYRQYLEKFIKMDTKTHRTRATVGAGGTNGKFIVLFAKALA